MNHQRHLIREAVVALLAAGGTPAGVRVFDEPYDPRAEFPALTVWDITEQQQPVTRHADAGRAIERVLVLEVRAEVQQNATAARARDQLLAHVEALLASAGLAGVKAITPAGYAPQQDHAGEHPITVGRQRFEILYFTAQGDPATPL